MYQILTNWPMYSNLHSLWEFLTILLYKNEPDGYKVAITGDGGDEMLGGYDYNVHLIRDKHPKILSKKFMNELEKFSYTKTGSKVKQIKKMINLLISLSFQHGTTSDGTPFVNTNNFNQDYLNNNLTEDLFFFKYNKKLNNLKNTIFWYQAYKITKSSKISR